MQVLEDKDNFLFNRKEVKIIVKAEKNPSFEEATQAISEQFKADKENIIVKEVQGKFGRKTFLISALVYRTKEDKEKYEVKKKEESVNKESGQASPDKEGKEPEQGHQEAKEELKPEEKPAEEKKE